MNWIQLKSSHQLDEIEKESQINPVVIFKHSTRCSTSRMSLDRLERNWNQLDLPLIRAYFLDLINNREISNLIAEIFGVEHESPQVLIIFKGKSVLDLSHFQIDYNHIKEAVKI